MGIELVEDAGQGLLENRLDGLKGLALIRAQLQKFQSVAEVGHLALSKIES